eukprot:UC4_evm1s1158
MNSDTLSLTFNEPVRGLSSFDPKKIYVSGLASAGVSYNLTGGELELNSQFDGKDVVILKLSRADLLAIKSESALARTVQSSRIGVRDGAVEDMAKVEIQSSLFGASLVKDTSPPALDYDGADLNLHDGILTLRFNDVVNIASLDSKGISLQDKASGSTSSVTLSSESRVEISSPKTGYSVRINLSTADLNRIKNNYDIASGDDNTYITIQSQTIEDTYGNNCVAIVNNKAIKVAVTKDSMAPTLQKFDLDIDGAGLLTLYFSETIKSIASLPANTLKILSKSNEGAGSGSGPGPMGKQLESYTLTGSVSVDLDITDPSVLKIVPSPGDLNEIKKLRHLARDESSTFLDLVSTAVFTDSSLRTVSPLLTPIKASNYTKDKMSPSVTSFSIDMDSGAITLAFSETVDPKTLDISKIKIQNNVLCTLQNGKGCVTFVNKYMVLDKPSDVIEVNILKSNLDVLKSRQGLASEETDTYLVIDGVAIRDMEGNPVTEIRDGDAKKIKAGGFTPDETKPELESFTVDLNPSITLNLVFSEPVYATNINVSKMMLQNGVSGPGKSIEMHPINADATFSKDFSTNVAVELSTSDVNAVKAVLDLFTTTKDSFLSIADGFVTDMNSQPLVVIGASEAKNATMVIVDSTRPSLVSFEMDMNATWNNATITLHFDETVSAASVDPKQITLQNKDGTQSLQLTGGTCDSIDGTTMEITLSQRDLNILKANRELVT